MFTIKRTNIFIEWLKGLKDRRAVARIAVVRQLGGALGAGDRAHGGHCSAGQQRTADHLQHAATTHGALGGDVLLGQALLLAHWGLLGISDAHEGELTRPRA